jgi:O-methyltransferase
LVEVFNFNNTEFAIWPGWFADTLPEFIEAAHADDTIAVLRLDGDWYDSTLECLNQVGDMVSDRGTVIVDDYYAWDGCARAVHDYLSRGELPYRIKSLPKNSGAYFIKQQESDSVIET